MSTHNLHIECLLYDLHNMADVANELLDQAIGTSHTDVTGHPEKFHLTHDQVSRLLFCTLETKLMAGNVIEAYCESTEPETRDAA